MKRLMIIVFALFALTLNARAEQKVELTLSLAEERSIRIDMKSTRNSCHPVSLNTAGSFWFAAGKLKSWKVIGNRTVL